MREQVAQRAASIDDVIAKLNECLVALDRMDCCAGTAEIDLAIVRLGGQPVVLSETDECG